MPYFLELCDFQVIRCISGLEKQRAGDAQEQEVIRCISGLNILDAHETELVEHRAIVWF